MLVNRFKHPTRCFLFVRLFYRAPGMVTDFINDLITLLSVFCLWQGSTKMATSTIKQGIRLSKVARRLIKPSYTGLTILEQKFIKATERLEQADKDLNGRNGFYATCSRINGAVNWASMTDKELDYFELINKQYERAKKALDRVIEKNNLSEESQQQIFRVYGQLNCHSNSF